MLSAIRERQGGLAIGRGQFGVNAALCLGCSSLSRVLGFRMKSGRGECRPLFKVREGQVSGASRTGRRVGVGAGRTDERCE